MSDSVEVCESELAVLEEIYEKKLKVTKKSYPQQFSLSLEAFNSAKADIRMKCTLRLSYTDKYPEEKPHFTISNDLNINDAQIEQIEQIFSTTADSLLGSMMVYDIISVIQEYLNTEADSCHARVVEEAEAERLKREKEEEAKFHGTKVTVESFNQWHKIFLEEQKSKRSAEEILEDAASAEASKKLTGRDLFLRDSRFDESEMDFFKDGGEVVEIDEKLFADVGDLDLDDIDLSCEEED
ncbi:RWD domain-containing protein 1 [Cichlidogyrus casuarinus]|uniref:RWD domain-containing protein 1 n=1 Tax=Cichlidogyrus casuarinus TaxID=1844966 RepID=A0ABD2QL58_9PLAT